MKVSTKLILIGLVGIQTCVRFDDFFHEMLFVTYLWRQTVQQYPTFLFFSETRRNVIRRSSVDSSLLVVTILIESKKVSFGL